MTKSMFVIPVKSYVDSENRYIETGLDRYMAKTTFFKSEASDWPPVCFMTDKNLTTLFIGSKKEKDTFSHTFLQRCNHSNQFTLCIKQNRQIPLKHLRSNLWSGIIWSDLARVAEGPCDQIIASSGFFQPGQVGELVSGLPEIQRVSRKPTFIRVIWGLVYDF